LALFFVLTGENAAFAHSSDVGAMFVFSRRAVSPPNREPP
jgi:hypothetical protein